MADRITATMFRHLGCSEWTTHCWVRVRVTLPHRKYQWSVDTFAYVIRYRRRGVVAAYCLVRSCRRRLHERVCRNRALNPASVGLHESVDFGRLVSSIRRLQTGCVA
jgi:hypothetical protein